MGKKAIKKKAGKKKAGKKKVVKKITAKGTKGGIVVFQKKATITLQVNNGPEETVEKEYGYTVYPADMPIASVVLESHNTRNMQDYNSLKVSVRLEDVTVANPKARADCARGLMQEVLDLTVEFTKKGAKRLFDVSL